MPWAVRIEQTIFRDLFTPLQRETHFAEFLLTGLLRGDQKARSDYYKSLFGIGALSPNDIRRLENMNPVTGGDQYFVPMNMASLNNPQPDAGFAKELKTTPMNELVDEILLEGKLNGASHVN